MSSNTSVELPLLKEGGPQEKQGTSQSLFLNATEPKSSGVTGRGILTGVSRCSFRLRAVLKGLRETWLSNAQIHLKQRW